MKNHVLRALVPALALAATGCITTRTAQLGPPSPGNTGPELYTTHLPRQNYVEVNYLLAEGAIFHTPEKLLAKLKAAAAEQGADAVVNIRYDYQLWWPCVSGTAVKYVD